MESQISGLATASGWRSFWILFERDKLGGPHFSLPILIPEFLGQPRLDCGFLLFSSEKKQRTTQQKKRNMKKPRKEHI